MECGGQTAGIVARETHEGQEEGRPEEAQVIGYEPRAAVDGRVFRNGEAGFHAQQREPGAQCPHDCPDPERPSQPDLI